MGRVPSAALLDDRRRIDASAIPTWPAWRATARGTLQRDDGRRPHREGGAGAVDRRRPGGGHAAYRSGTHPHSLFTAGLATRSMWTSRSPNCPAASLRRGRRARRRATGSSARLGPERRVAHLLLPEDLRRGLPPIDSAFGNFRDGGLDRPSGGAAPDIPFKAIESRTADYEQFLHGIVPDSGRPALHFAHVAFPHRPWEYLPDGTQYRFARTQPPGEHLIDTCRPPGRCCSSSCSRRATSIASSDA